MMRILYLLSHLVPLAAISLVAYLNAAMVGWVPEPPRPLAIIASATGLAQDWNVFAPQPALYYGWVSMPATLADGTTQNIYRDVAPRSQRWGRLVFNITKGHPPSPYLEPLAQYACRAWNRTHDASMQARALVVEIRWEQILKPHETAASAAHDSSRAGWRVPTPPSHEILWSGTCPQ